MLVLKNCYSIYTGTEILYNKNILIENNIITRITDASDKSWRDSGYAYEVIDCSAHIVIPGMVNTHHHFYQILTRNLPEVQNAELFDWLVYLYEIWKNLSPEAVYRNNFV